MWRKIITPGVFFIIAMGLFAQDPTVTMRFEQDETGVWISGYVGEVPLLKLPSDIEGYPIIGIYGGAFFDNWALTSVEIPRGMMYIANAVQNNGTGGYMGAFGSCVNLASVSMPSTLLHIGVLAFSRTALKSAVIPDLVKNISAGAFYKCKSLASVKLGKSVEYIGNNAFDGCPLKEASLPASIKHIDAEAFANCRSLTTVKIPASVKNLTIEEDAFRDCPLNSASVKLLAKYGYTHTVLETPKTAQDAFNRAYRFMEQGDYERAIADYTTFFKLEPKATLLYLDRGNAYYQNEEYDKAIEDYSTVLKNDPNVYSAYTNRGNANFMKRDYDKAIADFSEAIKLRSDETGAYFGRGSSFYMKGDYDKAVENFTQAQKLDPGNAAIRQRLEDAQRQQRAR